MRYFTRFLPLALCAAMLLSLPALAAEPAGPDAAPEAMTFAPVCVWGKVTKLEGGSLLITSGDKDAANPEVIVHLPEGTPCVDAVTGLPMDMTKVKDGDILYTWVGPAMTMSLPPQTNALVVVGNIPADCKVPEYCNITKTWGSSADGTYSFSVAGQENALKISRDVQVGPWLTRQMVRREDLVPGSQILMWRDKDNQIEKILLFPYAYRGYLNTVTAPNMDVLVCVNGLFDGKTPQYACRRTDEEVLAPLRSIAEAAGYDVAWVNGQGAVVKEGDKVVFSVLPGSKTVKRPGLEDGDWEMLTPCVVEKGVTYLPIDDLAMLLNLYRCLG